MPFVLALLFAASAACSNLPSHVGPHIQTVGVWDSPADPSSRPIVTGERAPSSEPRLYWKHQSKNFGAGPQGGAFQFSVVVPQINEWEDQEPFQDVRYEAKSSWEAGLCEGWDCSKAGGAGKSALWDQFYSAPKARKPAALADAIKGVGLASAAKLIDSGIFNKKPRSWDEFTSTLKTAERSGHISRDIVYQVTVKYRIENLGNLGYGVGACTASTYKCDVYVERVVPVSFTNFRPITRYTTMNQITRLFEVVVRNPQLQQFETDQFTLWAGHGASDVRISNDGPTRYQQQMSVQGEVTRIELTGVDRVRVDLPEGAIVKHAYSAKTGEPTFTLNVDPRYVPSAAGDDQLVLRYRIRTCKPFAAVCWGSWTESQDILHPITSAETNVKVSVPKGIKTAIVYSVARKNSRFYSDTYLRERETEDFRVK